MNKDEIESKIQGAVSMMENCDINALDYSEETTYSYSESMPNSRMDHHRDQTRVQRFTIFLTNPNEDSDLPLESQEKYEKLKQNLELRQYSEYVQVAEREHPKKDCGRSTALVLEEVSV